MPISTIAAIVGTVASVGTGVYSMLNSPGSINVAGGLNVKPFRLNQQQISSLNAEISQNQQLSAEAQATAQQAIDQYANGELTAAYAGQYEQAVDQQLTQTKQQLAAAGFTEGSTQYQSAMQNFQTWALSAKGTLLQDQLNAALTAAGISTQSISNINSILSTESGIASQANMDVINSVAANAQQSQAQTYALSGIGNAIGGIGKTLGSLGGTSGTSATGTGSTAPGPVSGSSNFGSGSFIDLNQYLNQ